LTAFISLLFRRLRSTSFLSGSNCCFNFPAGDVFRAAGQAACKPLLLIPLCLICAARTDLHLVIVFSFLAAHSGGDSATTNDGGVVNDLEMRTFYRHHAP
jgi:hypothetical protein